MFQWSGNFLSQKEVDDSDTENAMSKTYTGDQITDRHPTINSNSHFPPS